MERRVLLDLTTIFIEKQKLIVKISQEILLFSPQKIYSVHYRF